MTREAALFGVENYDDPDRAPFVGLHAALCDLSDELRTQPNQQKFSIYSGSPLVNEACTEGALDELLGSWERAPLELVTLVLAGHAVLVGGVPHFVTYGLPSSSRGYSLQRLLERARAIAETKTNVVLVLDFCFCGWIVDALQAMRSRAGNDECVERISVVGSTPARRTASAGSEFLRGVIKTLGSAPQTGLGVLLMPGFVAGVQERLHGSPRLEVTFFLGYLHANSVIAAGRGDQATTAARDVLERARQRTAMSIEEQIRIGRQEVLNALPNYPRRRRLWPAICAAGLSIAVLAAIAFPLDRPPFRLWPFNTLADWRGSCVRDGLRDSCAKYLENIQCERFERDGRTTGDDAVACRADERVLGGLRATLGIAEAACKLTSAGVSERLLKARARHRAGQSPFDFANGETGLCRDALIRTFQETLAAQTSTFRHLGPAAAVF